MARLRLTSSVTRVPAEPNSRRRRLPAEAIRLLIALGLLLLAGVSPALTNAPAGDAADARNASFPSRLPGADPGDTWAAPLNPAAELRQRDRAFRLIAGVRAARLEPVADLGSIVRRARHVSFSWREAEDSVLEDRDRLAATPAIIPASGYVSSGFSRGRMHPILELRRPHRGLDVVAPYGSPILATARGRVSFVGYHGDYGLTIELDHERGTVTRYAHASRALVRVGQQVARGDTIARVGRSGLADGPHVHYEVLVNGEPRNPRRYIFNPNVIPD